MIKLKADESLFGRFLLLEEKLKVLKSIVKNDTEVSKDYVVEWFGKVDEFVDEFDLLIDDVEDLLDQSNEE